VALPPRYRNPPALAALALAAACAVPQPLDWEEDALRAMLAFERHYMAGNTAASEVEFKRARAELSRTGRGDLVARAELRRCAVRAASLEMDECPGFEALRDMARAEDVAYAEYLAGRGARAAGSDPLGQVVFAAVQLKRGSLTPPQIAAAIEASSSQGWRRPLLAWLGVEARRAEQAGDQAAVERIRRRMALVAGS
jgi:hypothetical protein